MPNHPVPYLLEAKQLCFHLAGRQLIDNVSLTLSPHQLSVVIGPNGAGKSTLLRLLAGYYSPTAGQCLFEGRSMETWPLSALSKKRALMRQKSELRFPFYVEEVIAMGRLPHGKKHQKTAIETVLQQTNSSSLRHREYTSLSGGEQQRVQLARALAQLWSPTPKPACLFLDEPTSALDLYHQQNSLRLLHQLSRQYPFGVCCILHDLNLAALYADRIFLLHEGKLVAVGKPEEVLTQEILTRYYHADLTVTQHPRIEKPHLALNP